MTIIMGLVSSKLKRQQKAKRVFLLHADTERVTAQYLPVQDIAKLTRASRSNFQFFQPFLKEKKAEIAKALIPLLKAVVCINILKLKQLVRANPALLFIKGQISDPAGLTFYNVSPFQ